ncbi:MAG: penicillin acylase family protein, partial [Thermoplasmatales archaeon]
MQSHLKGKTLVVSIVLIVILLVITSVPFSALPPLQKFLNPSTGVWDPQIPSYSTGVQYLNITVNGSKSSVIIYREADGFIGIDSNTTWGMYYEQGYLEAEYRLEEMDFLKRTALGTLSQVVGPSALPSDIFYRTLEDSQLAQMEAVNISPTSETYMALHSFVLGINAYINSLNPGNMPLLFKLLNYKPHDWNVTDVLAIQQLFLWQNTPATFDPLYFNYALQKMPSYVVQAIYPSYPAGIQNPIVPYSLNPSIYDEAGDIGNLSLYTPSYNYSNISSYFISRNIAPAIVNYTQVNLDDSYIFKN